MTVSSAVAADEKAEVIKTIDGLVAAWNDNDPNAFADLYTEDSTIVTVEGLYCKGREPVRGLMTMLYSGPFKGSTLFNKVEDVRLITDDAAVAVCWNGILMDGLTELPPEEDRRATWVFSKKEEGWRIDAFQNVFITESTETG